jgi:acyl carrier protein
VTADEIRSTVLRAIGDVAPEADLGAIDPDASLRDQLDLDSMDLLNVMIALHRLLGVDIPETDYPELATLNGAVAYLAQRVAGRQAR